LFFRGFARTSKPMNKLRCRAKAARYKGRARIREAPVIHPWLEGN
jgi:hypothetical protein